MRQQHFSISKLNPVSPKELAPESFQMIMADSEEVMEYYYRGKIQELEQSLAKLNLLEHARQIAIVCKEIIRIKTILRKIIIKNESRGSDQISIK